jgi:glycerol-3-phosphate dehydrogenase (NAD+)
MRAVLIIFILWVDTLAYSYITSLFRGLAPSIPRVMDKLNVTVLGAGSFGTAIARRIALNIRDKQEIQDNFDKNVRIWLLDEICDDRSLVDIINEDHTNPKYLPNVMLPNTVIAYRSIIESVKDADIIVFGIPHQYISSVIAQIRGTVKPSAIVLSLSKGLLLEKSGPKLISDMILKELNCSSAGVLMGANLANEVANDDFVETVIASRDPSILPLMKSLFDADTFNVQLSEDVLSVELCGALKNIVAMAVGTCSTILLMIEPCC